MRKAFTGYLFSFCLLTALLVGVSGAGVAFAKAHSPLTASHKSASATCSGWSIVTSPNVGSGANQLYEVAAVSSGDVWAVGYDTDSSNVFQTLIEHWNGRSWSAVASPDISQAYNQLLGVAAISASNVWTVGTYFTSNRVNRTLIEHWNGRSWSIVQSPDVGTGSNVLSSVAVVAANDIWAVGSSTNSSNASQTLIEHWNGTSWSVVPSPNIAGIGDYLSSVAVVSANDIWAVGDSFTSNGNTQPLIEQWNGTSWRIWNNVGGFLNGVAAVSASDVWIVGYYQSSSIHGDQTLVKHWNGTRWNVVSSPNVGSSFNYLYSVAAVSASDVWTVGFNSFGQTVVEQWNGTNWSVVPSPNVSSSSNYLYSVAAVSNSNVWAVGDYYNISIGYYQTLIEYYC